ncbi:hypothetical protein QVZ41_14055 [Wenyingzhuangia sp. chi5]|uniref:Uncharacterized protein n=1 Tax=Wenyingzhuangia gilva TaxID=3057677 RepID=A0ABT8VVJ2_9FLAO|nr:hypothetical protein [Wenyingzhuangia sp. chi5]MDO3695971.1 hypothetical protein [Wenyingzhuangia sp. chi5]
MSYDIYFYRKQNTPLSKRQIQLEFHKLIPINISDIDTQINYENKRTGVYFLIDINEPNTEQEEIELYENFEGFEYIDISASINFLRPDYFGKEIFSILGKICNKLNLYIYNPQEFSEKRDSPLKWSTKELIEHWTEHNAKISRQHFNELELLYYPKDKSDKIWEYTSMIDTLENEMDEDIYIPNIFMIMNKETKEIFSYIVWSESIPLILPKVDFIILVKNYKRLFKKIEEIGIVKYEEIISKFSNEFENFENTKVDCLILKQSNADKMKKDFNSFPIWKSHKEYGSQIGLDNFVNHK